MNYKKGFTLIELLAVIAILGIILTIVVPSVTNVISDSKNTLHEQQEKQIESAAKIWFLESNKDLTDGEFCKISVDYIVDNGYIEGSDTIDPKTGETMEGYVELKHVGNQYTYTYKEVSTVSDCE